MSDEQDPILAGVDGQSILERFRLDGRVALITGAGQGIGRAFAHALGEAGTTVVVADIDDRRTQQVVAELHEKKIDASGCVIDLTAPGAPTELVAAALDSWGRLDIAVNNAGINTNSAAEDTSEAEWDQVMDLNLRSVFLCCQAQGRHMLGVGYGKIINTASMATLLVPHPQHQVAYNVSKMGVVKLTQTLAAEWGDRGVRVNCISPGIVRTALIEQSPALAPLVATWLRQIPVGRLAETTDLQGAIVFLAASVSDYMTGHNLVIEGGQSLW